MKRAPGLAVGVAISAVTLSFCNPGRAEAEDIRIHGQLTSTLRPDTDGIALNRSNRGETPFDMLDVDIFFDAAPSPDLQVRTWLAFNDVYPSSFSIAAAYLLWEAVDEGRLWIEAGKVPIPLGNYLDRFSLSDGPIVGTPLSWQFHSALARDILPTSANDLLHARGTGQIGPPLYETSSSSRLGAALLYAACYDLGAVAIGSSGALEYRLGLVAGTPGVPASGADTNENRTIAGRIGWSPGPAVRVGVSSAWGAYLPESVATHLPEGRGIGDYHQTVMVGDLELSRGHWTLYSEAVWGRYDTPFVDDDLDQFSYYLEMHRNVLPGLALGLRWDEILFGKIRDGNEQEVRWSDSQRRLELGAVYDIGRSLSVRTSLQLNHKGVGGFDPDANLAALQLIGRF